MSHATPAAVSCLRHHWFPTYGAAKGMARKLLKRKGRRLRPFECPMCKGYHLATDTRSTENPES